VGLILLPPKILPGISSSEPLPASFGQSDKIPREEAGDEAATRRSRRIGGVPATEATRVAPGVLRKSRTASPARGGGESVEEVDWVSCRRAGAYEEFTAGRGGRDGRHVGGYSAEEEVVLPCRRAPG
jgi:hypothetical protein